MFDTASAAVEAALAAGASYADARYVEGRDEFIQVMNGGIETLNRSEGAGVGVRALVGSSWGFFATADDDAASLRKAGRQAVEIARASAAAPGRPMPLADVPIVEADYETPVVEAPLEVPLAEKVDMLLGVSRTMQGVEGVRLARASLGAWDTHKWFVSSQGSKIHQHIVETGGGFDATAVGEHETQRRSFPQSFGQFETGGFERVRAWDYPGNAGRIAEEAVALLGAGACPEGDKTLILEASQLALQIHESVGHAIELDRILGWEAAFAGTSHLQLERLGQHRYGSEVMNITADATLPGALGTFAYDDEGTPAQCVAIVDHGRWVGVLSGRDSASIAGLPPGGMVRADGYNRLPMVRMTNVGLLPGDSSLEEMIAATEDGILMSTNRSWSIDDKRLNFQFGCEIGWEIKKGKRGRMVKNPTYTGITPKFWAQLDMLGGPAEWIHWGTPNCGKGQPVQIAHTGHSASPGRFTEVRVGVRA
ncbi:MAG: TldD/PmbA family protein [Actinomycetota bacterium]